MCLKARVKFEFHCTSNPKRPGYCLETFGDFGLDAVGAIADNETCLTQVADWVDGELAADGASDGRSRPAS